MATVELTATQRSGTGKGAARADRRAGRIPGVVYGGDTAPLAVSLDRAQVHHRILAGHFLTTIVELDLAGEKQRVIPREYQLHPVTDIPLHVDFMRLGEGATIRVSIPIHVANADQSPGVKRGGTVNLVQHAVEVRCRADAIPSAFEVDLAGLEMGHSLHLSDIRLPEGVAPVVAGDMTLVTIVAPSGYLEEQRAAAAQPAEGAAAAPAAGTPAAGAAPEKK